MKHVVNFLLLAFLFSCNEQQHASAPEAAEPAEIEETIVTETSSFGPPVHVNQLETIDPDSSVIMFPLAFAETSSKFSDDDESGSYSTSKTRSGNVGRYWNVIFYNYKSEESWLLANDKVTIQEIHELERNPLVNKKYIFYTIYINDINKDNKLTTEDPAYLYVSDRQGKGLRRLSAENMDVVNWNILPGTETLFLTCVKDTNGDKKFTEDDQQNTYRMDLKDVNAVPREIFTDAFKKEVQDQFKNHWKQKEK
jgi:hypothetical protein